MRERGHSNSGCPVDKAVEGEGGIDKQRQNTDQRKSGGVAGMFYRKALSYVCVCV